MNAPTLSASAPAGPVVTPARPAAAARTRTRASAASPAFQVLKWSLMSAAIFWTAVYKSSERGLKVPDFVYVNF